MVAAWVAAKGVQMAWQFMTTEERDALAPLCVIQTKPDSISLCTSGGLQISAESGSGLARIDGIFNPDQLRAIAAFIQPAAV